MSNDSELLQRIYSLLNEQGAELEMIRTVMKKFFLRIVTTGNPAGAEERLKSLKTDTMATLKAQPTGPVDQGSERMRQLIASRGEQFFRELEEYLAEAQKVEGGAGLN